MIPSSILKVFLPSVVSFVVGILITPLFTKYFYKYKLWKGSSRLDNDVAMSDAFKNIHDEKTETGTPRVGGIIIWFSVVIVILAIFVFSKIIGGTTFDKLDFLSRGQTLLPLAALVFGGLFGLFEDFLEIFTDRFTMFRQGLSSKYLVLLVVLIGLIASFWFYFKLGMHTVHIPFIGDIGIGWGFIPFFVLVVLGTFSSRVIDGIDGLAGGVMAVAFTAYGFIAYTKDLIDIAALCMVIAGGILAFLWFNIPPARFYMGETGMLGLTLTLAFVAFLTNSVILLLVIGVLLVATSFSSAVQIASKKYFGRKIFRIAPLHHHFQALGWSREKITMRYWIIAIMAAVVGVIISMVG
ncbi:MAG: hypothetical protein JWM20_202 [Patescibacteria group bacterium]|nr:hypothetical protein [Patescibacteria group bacterium]